MGFSVPLNWHTSSQGFYGEAWVNAHTLGWFPFTIALYSTFITSIWLWVGGAISAVIRFFELYMYYASVSVLALNNKKTIAFISAMIVTLGASILSFLAYNVFNWYNVANSIF